MLDVRLGTRLFVCSFTTAHGYGIDEANVSGGMIAVEKWRDEIPFSSG